MQLPEVLSTLNRWLRQGRNDKAVKITIECKSDKEFFNTRCQIYSEISSLQYMSLGPSQDLLPIKKIDGQKQFSFEMMGHSVTIKSKEVHAPRMYYRPHWPMD